MNKYSERIMCNVRQALGREADDTTADGVIYGMDPDDVFRLWLEWEGIIGYSYKIKEVVKELF